MAIPFPKFTPLLDSLEKFEVLFNGPEKVINEDSKAKDYVNALKLYNQIKKLKLGIFGSSKWAKIRTAFEGYEDFILSHATEIPSVSLDWLKYSANQPEPSMKKLKKEVLKIQQFLWKQYVEFLENKLLEKDIQKQSFL